MFAEEVVSPVRGAVPPQQRKETAALVVRWDLHAGEAKHGSGHINVERHLVLHDTAQVLRQARVMGDQGHLQGLIVVRPLPGKPPVPHVVAIVRHVDDDRVVREAESVQRLTNAADHPVHPADHTKVGPHISLILLRRIPPPEVSLAVHGCLQWVQITYHCTGAAILRCCRYPER